MQCHEIIKHRDVLRPVIELTYVQVGFCAMTRRSEEMLIRFASNYLVTFDGPSVSVQNRLFKTTLSCTCSFRRCGRLPTLAKHILPASNMHFALVRVNLKGRENVTKKLQAEDIIHTKCCLVEVWVRNFEPEWCSLATRIKVLFFWRAEKTCNPILKLNWQELRSLFSSVLQNGAIKSGLSYLMVFSTVLPSMPVLFGHNFCVP